MPEPKVAPYGSWRSPINAKMVAATTFTLTEIRLDRDDVYWLEGRPQEGGRVVIMKLARPSGDANAGEQAGEPVQVTPAYDAESDANFNVRTRVHEYGGGAYAVWQGAVFFSNFSDQRLYRQDPGKEPRPLTPPNVDLRYADYVLDPARGRLVGVREDHRAGDREAANTIVAVAAETGAAEPDEGRVLVRGHDFFSSPRLSPDGNWLAWLSWDHPNMPWDGTELWVARLGEEGDLVESRRVAGGTSESICLPQWSPGGELYFVSDRSGWWNLYRCRPSETAGAVSVEPVYPVEAEFALPAWVFGSYTYAFETDRRIVCCYEGGGYRRLALLSQESEGGSGASGAWHLSPLAPQYTLTGSVRARRGRAYCLAVSPAIPLSVIEVDLTAAVPPATVLRSTDPAEIDPGYISVPQAIEFPTEDGLTAFGFYYPPANKDYRGPDGEKPPLIVMSHGGPTAATYPIYLPEMEYWTSRGFALLDVNYGGSTGYGRAYRERLNGRWGIVDVDDCANGARYLAERGLVDGKRLAISGGSAGGYTTLMALTFKDIFAAGASYFGLSDLEPFATDTHKFESRYLDRLVGPYPECRDLYVERSPIRHLARLAKPMIFFQGLDDKIVPPDQSERMFEAVKSKGLPTAYLAFEGEGHGFRRAENQVRSLEAEYYFYSRIFGFVPDEELPAVEIANG